MKDAKFYVTLANELESHHNEQLRLWLQFVDKEKNIPQDFSMFGKCKQTNEKVIFAETVLILKKKKCNFGTEDCRGQDYDGAANISSEAVGVQGQIKEMSKKAVYTHCCGDNLCLVVPSACKIPSV